MRKGQSMPGISYDVGEPLETIETDDVVTTVPDPDEVGVFADALDGADDANLAASLTTQQRTELGQRLRAEVDAAAESMGPWLKTTAKGLREMGIDRTRSDTRSLPFAGASNSVFPLLAQAAVNFASRAALELCPPEGPCDAVVLGAGAEDDAEQDRAQRVKDFMNVQLLQIIEEWQDEHDKMLLMVPIEGSSFKKIWWDPSYNRIRSAYVPTEQIIMPYHAGSAHVSPLVANVIRCHRHEIRANIKSGLWLEHEPTTDRPQSSADADTLGDARDKVIGDEPAAVDEPETQTYCYYELAVRRVLDEVKASGLDAPYQAGEPAEWLVTIADGTGEVVAIRPNWRTKARVMTRRRRLVEYRMFPWAGSRGIGLFHLIGGLNAAATSALRAIFDAAMRASFPGGWKLKGRSRQSGTVTRGYGEYVEIDALPNVASIRDILMEDQFAGPHPVLSQLLEFLAQAGMQFASVALQEIGNATSTTPVGTTLARFEEGSKPFAAIFQRLHRSQATEFAEIYEINRETVSDEWLAERFEAPDIQAADFTAGISVVPVSDPRSFSQMQRTLRAELMIQVAEKASALGVNVDMAKLFKEAWDAAALPFGDDVFPEPPEPVNDPNPFNENAQTARGAPLAIGPDDDHQLHLVAHLALLSIPSVAQTPTGGGLVVHILEHAAVAATAAGPNGPALYAQVVELTGKLVEPPDTDGVRALAQAEMAKVDAKLVELQGREALEAARVQFDREKVAFSFEQQFALEQEKHRITLIEMEKRFDLEMQKLAKELRETQLKIASQERIKAADLAAKEPITVERPRDADEGAGASAKGNPGA
jgi:chaperonin GroES